MKEGLAATFKLVADDHKAQEVATPMCRVGLHSRGEGNLEA